MLVSVLVGCAAILAVAVAVLGVLFGRKVVGWRMPRTIGILSYGDGAITLPADERTTARGAYGVWLEPSGAHVLVGDPLADDVRAGTVTRRIVRGPRTTLDRAARWTGHVFAGPEDLGAPWREVLVPSSRGTKPAWLIGPASDEWAIHVHGLRTTRITALRTVPAAAEAGLRSLVISLRGDGEGDAPAASTLGLDEAGDVEAAVAYALEHGATRITLFGWSMGGAAVLRYLRTPGAAAQVDGIVLIAPAVDWRQVIANGARRAHLPAAAGRLAEWALQTPGLARLAGLRRPLRLAELDVARLPYAGPPALVLHSRNDPEIPFSASAAFAAAHAGLVTLRPFDCAGHAWECNAAPAEFTGRIVAFLAERRAAARDPRRHRPSHG